jgi:pimeloyl-ACP methyl ester carboxylesterase
MYFTDERGAWPWGTGPARAEPPRPPPLPPGRLVDVPLRGEMMVRDQPADAPAGTAGAPAILLLHGWTLCADVNWFGLYATVARHGRVLAMDVRGHGRGIRSGQPFTLEAAADDAAALLAHLGAGPAIVVGYSMGGSIALLMRRRHPESVAGLVLQSTALRWRVAWDERILWRSMGAMEYGLRLGLADRVIGRYLSAAAHQNPGLGPVLPWLQAEAFRGSPADIADAGRALSRFDARSYAPEVDVPTTVIVSRNDRLLSPDRQRELAAAIPGARTIEAGFGHNGWLVEPDRVGEAIGTAVGTVTEQVEFDHRV